jgi:pimeloyl-ACP methyl ester carboxylesterase
MQRGQVTRRSVVKIAVGSAAAVNFSASQCAAAAADIKPTIASGELAMPKVDVGRGVAIAYKDDWFGPPWETGEPIVLIHGVAESHVAWQQWMPILAPKLRVLRPDVPGFGQSPVPAGYNWTTAGLAESLIRFADALKVDRFHLAGAKFGGSIAMQLAIDAPDRIKSLAVFGSIAQAKADQKKGPDLIRAIGVHGWALKTEAGRLGSDAPPAMVRWWTDEFMGKADPRACIGCASAQADLDLMPQLGGIKAPTLVVTSEQTPRPPLSEVRAYQERIPRSRLLALPGNFYHVAAIRPEECARAVLQLIASV